MVSPMCFGRARSVLIIALRYKNGNVHGKVWGPWCGSALQFIELLSEPRWEDYQIEYETGNRFQFLGKGKTKIEETGGDLSWYVKEPGVDKC